jgi:hypothetical protein
MKADLVHRNRGDEVERWRPWRERAVCSSALIIVRKNAGPLEAVARDAIWRRRRHEGGKGGKALVIRVGG